MSDDDFDNDGDELFNDDFDDGGDTVLRAGVRKKVCPECQHNGFDYRVEGRFVVRVCRNCGAEFED
ncbi:MAG: hypothetical protein ACPGQL_10025 [Thermoplasmatota archaeon]